MGRYYDGDISGKFMFAIQPSDAADRFGVTGEPPSNELVYYFDDYHLDDVEDELKFILKHNYREIKLIKRFFRKCKSFTDDELAEYINLPIDKTRFALRQYADYILGSKIRRCIKKNGECEFYAEC